MNRPRDHVVAWASAALTSAYAGILALVLMFWARRAVQIRTLPERIMEASLRLVPPAQFEATIDRFGPSGKDYALYATTAVILLALFILGLVALRRLRSPQALLGLGFALYLLAMGAIMPLTGAGVFATALYVNPLLTNAAYFGIGMAYAATLLLGRAVAAAGLPIRPASPAAAPGGDGEAARRALLFAGAGSLAGLIVTAFTGRDAARVGSQLPLAAVPVTPPPTAMPRAAAAAETSTTAATAETTAPAASPGSTPAGATGPMPATSATPAAAGAASPTAGPTVGASSSTVDTATTAASPSTPGATAAPAPSPAAAATATPFPAFPDPPPPRPLPRDKDGALLAVQRPKGQVQAPVTSNADFYVVTKNAAGDPVLSSRSWRLIVDGAVARPVQLDYPTLLRLPSVTVYKTLECISNLTARCDLTSFGCDLISTARWTGVRLKDVLALAGGLTTGAASVVAFSADEYSSALPVEEATATDTLLVYAMNGAILPREHGFPVRLLAPNHYGLKNAKWVIKVTAMNQPYTDWWGQNGWSHSAVIKTMARLDVPVAGAVLPPGPQSIGGIAYAGRRGIAKVEYSADGGKSWAAAALTPGPGPDTFARWSGTFTLAAGQTAQLVCRATDGAGRLQIEQFSLPQPDGGAGWDSITVKAG